MRFIFSGFLAYFKGMRYNAFLRGSLQFHLLILEPFGLFILFISIVSSCPRVMSNILEDLSQSTISTDVVPYKILVLGVPTGSTLLITWVNLEGGLGTIGHGVIVDAITGVLVLPRLRARVVRS